MFELSNKRIILGITGGISAYKSAELVRRLRDAGAEVRVVMTRAATEFVTPLTFQAVSGQLVHTSLLDAAAESAMGHIELARWADITLVAPASADFLARLAHGQADDLLATLCLCLRTPLLVAPAMNQAMWANAATQDNIALLRERDIGILGPGVGAQACGDVGPGRMLEPEQLLSGLAAYFSSGALAGLRIMVTAGPTREAIDPVRYLGNRSSGKMGYAVARACMEAGARVTLVSGPVALPVPDKVDIVSVESARDMFNTVMQGLSGCDIFIGAAAVADYRPDHYAANKIKKSGSVRQLELVPNPDVIAAVAAAEPRPFVVGFAAETENLADYARAKQQGKGLDMVAANLVSETSGIDADDNALEVYWENGGVSLERAHKTLLARRLVEVIAERYALNRDRSHKETKEHAKSTIKDS